MQKREKEKSGTLDDKEENFGMGKIGASFLTVLGTLDFGYFIELFRNEN